MENFQELKPRILTDPKESALGIFNDILGTVDTRQEIRIVDKKNERPPISFFIMIHPEEGALYLHFEEFSNEAVRREFKSWFDESAVEDIEPRGFRVKFREDQNH